MQGIGFPAFEDGRSGVLFLLEERVVLPLSFEVEASQFEAGHVGSGFFREHPFTSLNDGNRFLVSRVVLVFENGEAPAQFRAAEADL